MDTTVIMILLIIGAVVSLVLGIIFFIMYKTKRKTIYLILGVVLTFVVPAIILYFAFNLYTRTSFNPMIVYGPDPMIAYGPGPL